ncbi:MAG: response regulator [Blastocatellia bacterium]
MQDESGESKRGHEGASSGPWRQCLIVDDSAFSRLRLRKMLDTLQFSADEAENGREAVTAYQRSRPDVVLMDIVMPGLEGVEAVREICADDPSARVIMISSVSHREKVAEALAAGARGFITKPVMPGDLRQELERILKQPATV